MDEKLKFIYIVGCALNRCKNSLIDEIGGIEDEEQLIKIISQKIACDEDDINDAKELMSTDSKNYKLVEPFIIEYIKKPFDCNSTVNFIAKQLKKSKFDSQKIDKTIVRKLSILGEYKYQEEMIELKGLREKISPFSTKEKKTDEKNIKDIKGEIDIRLKNIYKNLLYSDIYSEALSTDVKISNLKFGHFKNKYELAKYLYNLLNNFDQEELYETQLWNWLSLFHYQLITGGPGWDHIIYCYDKSSDSSKRHLLFAPHEIYKRIKERSKVFLTKETNVKGDMNEQGLQNIHLMTENVVDCISNLYFKEDKFSLKSGSDGNGKGGMRRFIYLYKQILVNYSLATLSMSDFLLLLDKASPKEFEKFQ